MSKKIKTFISSPSCFMLLKTVETYNKVYPVLYVLVSKFVLFMLLFCERELGTEYNSQRKKSTCNDIAQFWKVELKFVNVYPSVWWPESESVENKGLERGG